jgi:hypothetical protein
MGTTILGRITGTIDSPRGPDAQMSVSVPEEWIAGGATLQIALPRNLTCATCHGGGCDRCERSGAVSLRSRRAEVETVEVTLPKGAAVAADPAPEAAAVPATARSVVVRIPERGGLPETTREELPRGNLLVSIRPGPEPSRGVTRLKTPSVPAPPSVPEILDGVEPPPELQPSVRPAAPSRAPSRNLGYVALSLAVAAIVSWLLSR